MENIICNKCGSDSYRIEQRNIHNTAVCNNCNSYIKHIPKQQKPQLHFGKYKGEFIDAINDIPYLKWVLKETKQSDRLRNAIALRISEIENLLR